MSTTLRPSPAPKDAPVTIEQLAKLFARHDRSIEWLEGAFEELSARTERNGTEEKKDEKWLTTPEAIAILHLPSRYLRRHREEFGGRRKDPSNPNSHWLWPQSVIQAKASADAEDSK